MDRQPMNHRDYIERTIATVRNHREADNCWPQWANIFADEIEALWHERDGLRWLLDNLATMAEDENPHLALAVLQAARAEPKDAPPFAAVPDPEGRKESYCANCGKPIHLDRKAWVHAEGNVTCEPSLPMEDTPEWFAKHAAVPDPEEDAT
jgi:hypothetical protein